jgi:hypothetical protein
VIPLIDVSLVLRSSVRAIYTDLVTRSTGAAVREQIERQLDDAGDAPFVVIDFSHVGLLDFSCADEIVAKLLLRHRDASPGRHFVFRGMSESHLDALEAVLERHGLALALECSDGAWLVVGAVSDEERAAFRAALRLERVDAEALAEALGAEVVEAGRWLDVLARHRLVVRCDDGWVAVPLTS